MGQVMSKKWFFQSLFLQNIFGKLKKINQNWARPENFNISF